MAAARQGADPKVCPNASRPTGIRPRQAEAKKPPKPAARTTNDAPPTPQVKARVDVKIPRRDIIGTTAAPAGGDPGRRAKPLTYLSCALCALGSPAFLFTHEGGAAVANRRFGHGASTPWPILFSVSCSPGSLSVEGSTAAASELLPLVSQFLQRVTLRPSAIVDRCRWRSRTLGDLVLRSAGANHLDELGACSSLSFFTAPSLAPRRLAVTMPALVRSIWSPLSRPPMPPIDFLISSSSASEYHSVLPHLPAPTNKTSPWVLARRRKASLTECTGSLWFDVQPSALSCSQISRGVCGVLLPNERKQLGACFLQPNTIEGAELRHGPFRGWWGRSWIALEKT